MEAALARRGAAGGGGAGIVYAATAGRPFPGPRWKRARRRRWFPQFHVAPASRCRMRRGPQPASPPAPSPRSRESMAAYRPLRFQCFPRQAAPRHPSLCTWPPAGVCPNFSRLSPATGAQLSLVIRRSGRSALDMLPHPTSKWASQRRLPPVEWGLTPSPDDWSPAGKWRRVPGPAASKRGPVHRGEALQVSRPGALRGGPSGRWDGGGGSSGRGGFRASGARTGRPFADHNLLPPGATGTGACPIDCPHGRAIARGAAKAAPTRGGFLWSCRILR